MAARGFNHNNGISCVAKKKQTFGFMYFHGQRFSVCAIQWSVVNVFLEWGIPLNARSMVTFLKIVALLLKD